MFNTSECKEWKICMFRIYLSAGNLNVQNLISVNNLPYLFKSSMCYFFEIVCIKSVGQNRPLYNFILFPREWKSIILLWRFNCTR